MSFGRNPHVVKAQTAEQEAQDASDSDARARAYRAAAHLWDRAAEREKPGKTRNVYEANAIRNRDLAESPPDIDDELTSPGGDPRTMN